MIKRTALAFTALAPFVLASSCAPPPAPPAKVAITATVQGRAQKGVEAGDVNRSVDACTDFYEFANGTWRAANPIPTGKPRWSRRGVAREANRQQLRDLLEEVSAKRDLPAKGVEQVIGDHYASCMDEAAADAAGLTPLAALLADIDAVQTAADVQRIVRRLHDLGIFAAFGTTGAFENREPTTFLANVTAGGLGMPDRDAYLSTDAKAAETRDKYKQHVANVLKLGGAPETAAGEAAVSVLALEKRLAQAALDAKTAADPVATEHKTTYAQLKEMTPRIDWDAYFDEAKMPRGAVNVADPTYMHQLDKELKDTPVAVWKTYLRFQLLDSASPWLSKAFAMESFQFKDKVLAGAAEMKPRAARCLDSTEALFGEALGKKYAERYFPPAAKAKAQEIARTLLAALEADVAASTWMTPETKKKAKEKLAVLNVQLGYPDTWKDYGALTIRRDALWANVAQGRKFNVDDNRKQVGKPTDRRSWLLPPSSPDAYLDPQLSELVLPAGFLQPPLFDVNATDAVNYGAFGAGLAHDMTHSVDASGSVIDPAGRAEKWWTTSDEGEFQKRAQCVSEQYEGYAIEPGVHHQGKLVRSEAIGDSGGLHLAYAALEKSMETRPVPTDDGFTPEQQFFLAWGQFRGEAVRIEAQREMVKSDPHPVPKFRVVGPLSNMPEFQQAFSCKAGAPMVRPKETRCAVW